MNAEPTIHVSNLGYSYGGYRAVDHADFAVHPGEIFALLGTNGAGKTTTLEVIEGFRQPASGSVRLLGHDPYRARSRLGPRVGTMLQQAGLIDELSVAETVRLWARLSSRHDDLDDLLATVGLADRRNSTVEKLSGGEQRRLDFALAIWGSPEVLILDEPTTGLDPQSRQRLWKTVGRLRDRGATILLTTHYLEEAEALADRVAIMHEGRISISGTLAEVLDTGSARISAELPANAPSDLPVFTGTLTIEPVPDGTAIVIETPDIQTDLDGLLEWARHRRVRLHRLNATQASLHEVFLGISELEKS